MRKPLHLFFTVMLIFLVTDNVQAKEKARLGPCVRACVQAYNPSLADSGADEFLAEDFRGRECVRLCKQNIYEGECYSWADACCNADFTGTDPDCQPEPPDNPEPPEPPGDEPPSDPPDNPEPPDPTGNSLPPDPGEAGKATLEGIDSDNDGLRDDIQRYIGLTYPDSRKTRAALRQAAIALQTIILNSPDEASALNNTELEARASECLWYIHPDTGSKMDDLLMAEFLNTMARSRAYLSYNSKLGGHVFRSKDIDEYRTSCTFDPDLMED